jgi:hypothetical protein
MKKDTDKKMFIEFAKILKQHGIDLQYDTDSEYYKKNKKLKYTDVPYIGSGMYGGIGNGFYFKKADYSYWTATQIEKIKELFKDLNYGIAAANLVVTDQPDWDDDRMWAASIGFTVSIDGKNILD